MEIQAHTLSHETHSVVQTQCGSSTRVSLNMVLGWKKNMIFTCFFFYPVIEQLYLLALLSSF